MPVLLMTVPQTPFAPAYVLVSGVAGGLISVGWAATFVFRRFAWLLFIVPSSAILPWGMSLALARAGVAMAVPESAAVAHRLAYTTTGIISIVVGYVVLVKVIRQFDRVGARSRAELDVARKMHELIVPLIETRTRRAEIYSRSEPSSEMGGDLIDVVIREGGSEVDLFLADVSGHGVGAGIVMGMLKASIRTRLLAGGDLGTILTDVNRITYELTKPEMFATLACLRLTPDGMVRFALAGHLPIFHFSALDQSWRTVDNEHLPLGVEEVERFGFGSFAARPHDVLAIFSDGLVEVRDERGREFGLNGMAEALQEAVRVAPARELKDVYQSVMDRVRSFGPSADDQTLLLVRVC